MCKPVTKFADICVIDAAILRNKLEIIQINQVRRRLDASKRALKQNNRLLKNSLKSSVFELMNSMSHRKFCRLMGI